MTQPSRPRGIVLFGAGAGGDPRRYSTILDAFSAAGFVVLAPAGERFTPQSVTTEQLQARVEDLRVALESYPETSLPVVAAGHSVGGWATLCLAGAQPWGKDGAPIPVVTSARVSRLVLFAPTLGWFRAPGALNGLTSPIAVHMGALDTITPAATAEDLRAASVPMTIAIHENVGHHDFMTDLPPRIDPTPGLDREAFLRELSAEIVEECGSDLLCDSYPGTLRSND